MFMCIKESYQSRKVACIPIGSHVPRLALSHKKAELNVCLLFPSIVMWIFGEIFVVVQR